MLARSTKAPVRAANLNLVELRRVVALGFFQADAHVVAVAEFLVGARIDAADERANGGGQRTDGDTEVGGAAAIDVDLHLGLAGFETTSARP